eukprot:446900_1
MAFWDNGIVSFILSVVSGTLISFMLGTFIKHEFICKQNKEDRSALARTSTFLLLTVYLLFAVHTSIDALYAMISTASGSFSVPWCISQFLETFVYAFGKVNMYLFFVLRLHEIFKGSAFGVSIIKLKILAVMFILPTVIFSMLQVYTAIKPLSVFASYHPIWNDINQFSDCTAVYPLYRGRLLNTLRVVGVALYAVMDIFCPFIVLRLFLSRLMSVAINLSATLHEKRNRSMARLCVKTTNLCILSVCLNWIILVKFGGKLPIAILHIDAITNCLAVFLSYDFAFKYYKYLFKPCHHLCYNMCIKCCYCCCAPSSSIEMGALRVISVEQSGGSGTSVHVESPRSLERSDPTMADGSTRAVELSSSGGVDSTINGSNDEPNTDFV